MKHYRRYIILFYFILFFLCASFVIRLVLLLVSWSGAALSVLQVLKIFALGFVFDLGIACFFTLVYSFYLLLLPQKWNNTKLNRIITYCLFFLLTLIVTFSFFAEVTFWQEFKSRFNFIAVDYLIYTYEVIHNINESYPLPFLVAGMISLTLIITLFFYKRKVFSDSFLSQTNFLRRLAVSVTIWLVCIFYGTIVTNAWAEGGDNRYSTELSKAGIWSFFSAFKNNELSYDAFYKKIDTDEAFNIVRSSMQKPGITFTADPHSMLHTVQDTARMQTPNVIMITIESFSASFMGIFGNKEGLTPVLDSLAGNGISFTNMYATGTRTVRGMEALSLAVPPTPGNSIVRRPGNDSLQTVGYIFNQKGYQTNFIYGGDGYFDNMNKYFGTNGYDIVDRLRNNVVDDEIKTQRTNIPDNKVHFENAWGICDEDLYDAVIDKSDISYNKNQLFYNFVMTTSNHRPFTFPDGKNNMPHGTREAAIRYTDYAIGALLTKASTRPWFNNTVFIFVADHCASSAGKNEIDIDKYHIPCIVYNPAKRVPLHINVECSQIDLYPTLFGLLGWQYKSSSYGFDVLDSSYTPRILLGTYQKLGFMKNDSLVILSPQQTVQTYSYNPKTNEQIKIQGADYLTRQAIAQYQSAYYLFKNRGFHQ